MRYAATLTLTALALAGCQNGDPRPIGALPGSKLEVSMSRAAEGGVSVSITLLFDDVGKQLGDACPVVVAAARVGGRAIAQEVKGGPTECGFDAGDCTSGVCTLVAWRANLPGELTFADDGTISVDIADAGPAVHLVAPADMRADLSIGDVPKYPYYSAPHATLTVAPRPPFDTVALPAPPGDPQPTNVPILSIDKLTSGSFFADLQPVATGPLTFDLTFPAEADLPRPATGQFASHLGFTAPIQSCEGVSACSLTTSSDLPALSVPLP